MIISTTDWYLALLYESSFRINNQYSYFVPYFTLWIIVYDVLNILSAQQTYRKLPGFENQNNQSATNFCTLLCLALISVLMNIWKPYLNHYFDLLWSVFLFAFYSILIIFLFWCAVSRPIVSIWLYWVEYFVSFCLLT